MHTDPTPLDRLATDVEAQDAFWAERIADEDDTAAEEHAYHDGPIHLYPTCSLCLAVVR